MERTVVIVLASFAAATAWSQTAELVACRVIQDPIERVACYDAAIDAAPPTAAEPAQAVDPEEMFGRSSRSIKEVLKIEEIAEISSTVTEIRKTALGRMVIGLENNQTWTQVDSTRIMLKPGEEVKVRAGVGGSHFLNKITGSRSVKVKRTD